MLRGVSGSHLQPLKTLGKIMQHTRHESLSEFELTPLFYWCRVRALNSRPTVYKDISAHARNLDGVGISSHFSPAGVVLFVVPAPRKRALSSSSRGRRGPWVWSSGGSKYDLGCHS